jgi:hypothetical protein
MRYGHAVFLSADFDNSLLLGSKNNDIMETVRGMADREMFEDQVLRLDDGTGADIEWEADISLDDLRRFLFYNAALARKYKIPFHTCC